MIHSLLIARLRPALDRQRTLRRRCWLSGLLVVGAAALFVAGPAARPWVVTALVAGAAVLWFATWLVDGEPRELARRLEKRHPDLDGRLATAVEQEPDAAGRFSFLQERLIEEALRHSTEREWAQVIPARRLHGARAAMLLAAVLFAGAWVSTRSAQPPAPELATQPTSAEDVTVQPGDVELERGSALVVMAKFDRDVPVAADLVTGDAAASEKRVPLTKNLSDPVFGGSVPDVQQSFSYRVEHDGRRTRDFRVTVFEYPRLERSDLTLTFPGYTKLEPRRLEDSRRASAVEGTRLDAELQLNKPVASAILKPKEAKGTPLTLEVSADKAVARLRGHVPVASATYDLVLTDADGRTNKKPAVFSFDVLPNRTPELKLTSPRGDQRPSALQELAFDGTAWDDFGVLAYGLAIARPAAEPEYIELGRGVAAREKQPFHHLLKFEEMKAQPDDLYSWFVWADDLGPDGKVRRTTGDLFFGEIRPFEEIFRQGEAMGSQDQQQQEQQQGQQGQGNQVAQLAELQKQIMVATWKLQRASATDSAEKTKADAAVVLESQQQAKSQAEEAAAQGGDSPQAAGQWKAVTDAMDQAIASLGKVPEDFKELAVAQGHEQTAYQTLLRLRAREKEVAMQQQQQQQQGGQQGQNSGQQQERQQLEQLDLAKDENRYEQERQAQNPQSAERREQAQVINRLQELAKRQQDVNEKLQELQTALQEAKTEEEREEARRQLKRLEEEQRQMVADADELRQRMERPENQSRMEEQRQQLDQARDAMQQAAEAAQEGQTGQALAAGTRAERQMQEMREQLRQQSSSQFAEDLKNMRAEARDLAQQQEKLARELAGGTEEGATPQRKSLGDDAAADPKQAQLERQQQRTAELVKQATALSEEAEAAEPLLSRQLYDAARQFSQEDAGAVKEMQEQMLKEGELTERMFMDMKEIMEAEDSGRTQELAQQFLEQNNADKAADAAQRGRAAMDSLRQGVEKAAESVLGDDTAALEFAEAQLKAAADALRNEMAAEGPGGDPAGKESTAQNTRRPGEAGREPAEPGDDEEGRTPRPGRGQRGAGETAQNDQADPQGGGGGEPGEENQQQNGNPRSGRGQRGAGEMAQNEGNQGDEPGRETAESSRPQRGQRGQGEQSGEGQGGGRGEAEGQEPQTAENDRAQRDGGEQRGSGGGRSGVAQNRGGNPNSRGGGSGGGERGLTRPLTSEGFIDWSDRLRDVEELVDFPELRNEVATARERARTVRLEARREMKKPDWAVVELQILKPLVEVQQRLREELARRSPDKSLVPFDRDPVPAQYSDAVRRYYEQLGAVK